MSYKIKSYHKPYLCRLMAEEFYNGTVTNIIDESPTVKRYFIAIDGVEQFDFLPGQFVMLDMPIQHEFTTRSYSIASAPKGNEIELCIVLKNDGQGTPYLFKNIKVGSTLKVSAAQGRFYLKNPIETDICLIATGTGVAPLRSMLHHIFNNNIAHKNVYLVFGNRTEKDILYRAEFEELEKQYSEFKFLPTLSREEWEGEKGYVHHVYQKLFNGSQPAVFYICGWSSMVKEAKNNLKAMGYPRKQVNFELYD